MPRQSGWYWVKFKGVWKVNKWIIALNGDGFFVESNGWSSASESFMDEVNETRIKTPDEE